MTDQLSEKEVLYEVEVRFCVPTADEAYRLLPFLAAGLGPEKPWYTQIIGRDIYEAGKLLRVGYVPPDGSGRTYLGYKGRDEGTFANIRQEWGEEVTDGAIESIILAQLGLPTTLPSSAALLEQLAAAGHTPFMDFAGVDRQGYVSALDVHTKLMRCPKILGDQFMVELELTAASKAESELAQEKLQQIAAEYAIADRLIREEPPTLLYQVSFP